MAAVPVSSSATSTATSRLDLALLILRVVIGVIFLAHGWQKLFVFGFGGVIEAFGKMGVPAPTLFGPVVCLVELLAGLALIVGILTRVAGILVACDMLGAILLVHLKNGLFASKNGFELPLALLAAAVALVLAGAGAYSADAALSRKRMAG